MAVKRDSIDSEAFQREGVARAVGGRRRQMRLGGPYAEELEPASELRARPVGDKSPQQAKARRRPALKA